MIIIRDKDFNVISRTKNLRAILEYTRSNIVERVDIWPNSNGAQFGVTWINGASCISEFASDIVCAQFFRHRIERFPNIIIHGTIAGINN